MVKILPLATYKQYMQRLGQDLNGVYAQLVRAVKLANPTRLSNNFEIGQPRDSVFNNHPKTCSGMATITVAAGTDALESSFVVAPRNMPRLPSGALITSIVHGIVPSSWFRSTLT